MIQSTFSLFRFETRAALGKQAALDVAATIRALLAKQPRVRMVFAAAPSQDEFLAALREDTSIDFGRIDAFHMDEYVGLAPDASQGFGNFLRVRLFDRVPFGSVAYINGLPAIPMLPARNMLRRCVPRPSISCAWASAKMGISPSTTRTKRILWILCL